MFFYCNNKKGYCDDPLDCDNCDVWVHGKGGKFVPTNGDRIRAMSDEELAKLFWSIIHERELLIIEKLNEQGIEASLFEAPNASVKAHMEWLKQPAEEEV